MESIQKQNGIVQYDSESTMLTMEVIDFLLKKLKFASSNDALIGQAVESIAVNLMPPTDVISKIVKEFLMENQPCQEVLGLILFAVRSNCRFIVA